MEFLLGFEIDESVKNVSFLRSNIEKPLKEVLSKKDYHLREYEFFCIILSKRFKLYRSTKLKINKKSKIFTYVQDIDADHFNGLTEEFCLRLICTEMKVSLDKYDELKPKTYKNDGFREDVLSVIEEWL